MDFDLREIDQDLLYDRLTELEAEGPYDPEAIREYESLLWIGDLFYLIMEGFVEMNDEGQIFRTDLTCPDVLP